MKDAVKQGYKLATQGDICIIYRQLVQVLIGIAVLKNVVDDFKNCVHMLQEGRHH